jgi:hypothetical protein
MVLESERYRKEEETLMHDPIIIAMANEIVDPDGVDMEAYEFMVAASDTYKDRGGFQARSIGGPARAIRRLKGKRA